MIYSAATFLRWAADLRRWRALAGLNCSLDQTANGTVVSGHASGEWKHPWQVRCSAGTEGTGKPQWRAKVRPGFVNGRDATIGMDDLDDRGKPTGRLIQTPLTGEDGPSLALETWRNPLASAGIAESGAALPGEGYPKYFEQIGVKPAIGGAPNSFSPAPEQDPERTREIRACDIFLWTPRVSATTRVSILEPLVDQQAVDLKTSLNTTALFRARADGSYYQLKLLPKWTPPKEPTMLDRLLGIYDEPQSDELKIATVWIVSPPDASPDAEPDESWTPYVQHFVFWNLMHAPRRPPLIVPQKPIRFFLPLLAGAAQPIIDSILTPLNDAYAAVSYALQDASYKGEFWSI